MNYEGTQDAALQAREAAGTINLSYLD